MTHSRRDFIACAIAAPALIAILQNVEAAGDGITIVSPNRRIQFFLSPDPTLRYVVTLNGKTAVDWSRLAISLDGKDITNLVSLGKVERYRISESYATRGVHSTAANNCNGARISLQHQQSAIAYVLEIRAYNDGVAFRFVIPGGGKPGT